MNRNRINTSLANRKHLLWLVVCLILTGCSSSKRAVITPIYMATPQADTTLLPSFSSEVLYVLGREWEAIYDSTSQKFYTPQAEALRADSIAIDEYLERRLIQLYPEKAYSGYINKVEKVVQSLLSQTESYSHIANFSRAELNFISNDAFATSPSEHNTIATSAADIPFATMAPATPNEQQQWEELNHIAQSADWANREALDSLEIDWFEDENLLISMMIWRGPRFFYRIIQSKARAEKMAAYYYGDQTNSGMQGDAFRHIYVNVLLRSYVGEWVSKVVMDIFWETVKPNAPCDRYMDLHNNLLGRQIRYHEFVQTDTENQCQQVRNWLQWAEQVQQFVQDSINSHSPTWDKETPTFIVQPEADKIPQSQYIYWQKQSTPKSENE